MSQENVEVARRSSDAFRRGDREALAATLDPHVLLRLDPTWPEQRVYGRAAALDFFRSASELLGPDSSIQEIMDLGDRLLIRVRWTTRGHRSGIEEGLASEVVTYRDGFTAFIEYFLDHHDALDAVGLAEQRMSHENVEIVRRLLEACNRRDFDAMLETGDPEIEIVTLMSGTYRGHAGWRQVVEQMAEEVSGFQFVPEDLIEVGQDRVVAVTSWVGTGRTSGIAVPDTPIGFVYTLRNGLVVRQESFPSEAEALKSVGLAEQAMSQENVEIVRGIYDAFARRDNAAPFAAYAPDIELDFRHGGFDAPSLYHGHDGVRTAFRNWLAPFRDFEFQPGETKDYGDQILVTVHEHGIGRASGVAVDRSHYVLWARRGGKIVSLCVYLDQAEALKAVGLAGQAMSQENVDTVRRFFDATNRGDFASAMAAYAEHVNSPSMAGR